MAYHKTGPLLNADKDGRGARAWYSKMPMVADPDYIVYYNDFLTARDLDSTNEWAVTKDASATVAIGADADGGSVVLTSAATTDNDGALLQSTQESFSMSSGKQLWFECKLQVSDADQMDVFAGLCTDASITNPEDILSEADRAGFQINDGAASILTKSEKNGTEESNDSGQDAADATNVTLGMYWDGVSTIEYYIDRALVASHTTTIPDDEQLAIALFELSGDATGTKSMTVDYVYVCQER